MAVSTSSHVRNIKEHPRHRKVTRNLHPVSHSLSTKQSKTGNSSPLKNAVRYEKHCKYWSILSNVAAIVSVTSAVYSILNKNSGFLNKKRFW